MRHHYSTKTNKLEKCNAKISCRYDEHFSSEEVGNKFVDLENELQVEKDSAKKVRLQIEKEELLISERITQFKELEFIELNEKNLKNYKYKDGYFSKSQMWGRCYRGEMNGKGVYSSTNKKSHKNTV